MIKYSIFSTDRQIIKSTTHMELNLSTNIKEIMTENYTSVTPGTLMNEVAALFANHDWHHLPVLDMNQRVVGMISSKDYCQLEHPLTRLNKARASKQNERLMSSLTAEDIMTADPVTIHHEASLASAIAVFLENQFHILPVIKNDKCIGLISPMDILQYIQMNNLIPSE